MAFLLVSTFRHLGTSCYISTCDKLVQTYPHGFSKIHKLRSRSESVNTISTPHFNVFLGEYTPTADQISSNILDKHTTWIDWSSSRVTLYSIFIILLSRRKMLILIPFWKNSTFSKRNYISVIGLGKIKSSGRRTKVRSTVFTNNGSSQIKYNTQKICMFLLHTYNVKTRSFNVFFSKS